MGPPDACQGTASGQRYLEAGQHVFGL